MVTPRKPTTPRYRYVLADLLTDQNIATLPLDGVSFGKSISRTGGFRGDLTIGTREQGQLAMMVASMAGRSSLYVYRNNRLWWGGILWSCTPSQGARGTGKMSLTASTFNSYLSRREIRSNLVFTGVDQALIMTTLIEHMQSDPYGNIGLLTNDSPLTGILRDRTYGAAEGASYGQRIEELGDVIDGPEHTINVFDNGSNRTKVFKTGNLRLGAGNESRLLVTATRVPDFSRLIDASNAGTHFVARGDNQESNIAEEAVPLVSTEMVAIDMLAAGWPRLDVTTDHQGVVIKETLDKYALGEMSRRSGQSRVPSYTLDLTDSDWNPNLLGDTIIVRRSSRDWFEPGLKEEVRPVAVEISPPTRSEAVETVKITVEEGDAV